MEEIKKKISLTKWERMNKEDGSICSHSPSQNPISKSKSLQSKTRLIATSGGSNSNPGMDIFRFDEKDDPYVINKDHYKVITSGTKVIFQGPKKDKEHHLKKIPQRFFKEQ